MRVLGIDPGLRVAGYGCIDATDSSNKSTLVEAGAIKLNTKKSVSFRLAQLYKDIQEVIDELKPDLMAVETIFTAKLPTLFAWGCEKSNQKDFFSILTLWELG